jgi:hypothetical protein
VWEKARIPTLMTKHAATKVEGIFREWEKLKKKKRKIKPNVQKA